MKKWKQHSRQLENSGGQCVHGGSKVRLSLFILCLTDISSLLDIWPDSVIFSPYMQDSLG